MEVAVEASVEVVAPAEAVSAAVAADAAVADAVDANPYPKSSTFCMLLYHSNPTLSPFIITKINNDSP